MIIQLLIISIVNKSVAWMQTLFVRGGVFLKINMIKTGKKDLKNSVMDIRLITFIVQKSFSCHSDIVFCNHHKEVVNIITSFSRCLNKLGSNFCNKNERMRVLTTLNIVHFL